MADYKFQVGDTVTRTDGPLRSNRALVLQQPPKRGGRYMVQWEGSASPSLYDEAGLKLVEGIPRSRQKGKKKFDPSWTFDIRHMSQIDFIEIEDDTTPTEPINLIEVGDEYFICIYPRLYTKTFHCKGGKKLREELDDLLENEPDNYYAFGVKLENVSKIVDVVRRIKAAPYKKEGRKVCTVKVTPIKV